MILTYKTVKLGARKLENEIGQLEEIINSYHEDMMKEEIYMSIDKSREVELKIKDIDKQLEDKMIEWEEIMKSLEN